ncbi:hypothetical protein HYH03_000630 [Edaphochlamys debaryana]|uniref:Mitochondrial carrier protein n=1 Tax=Edaphochlamys debaryana TaxID=47281 RepID=A0A835YG83_9CHLO|nr:hypothetical protein HYH03_000630 [Edaphochlamys debaryana]|eukprot:KAG2502143.1 hypothetical protein HYH03_000630 [Edaphochlamys debaryana]
MERPRQPELQHRIIAAAGASVVSAVLVNPLDVVKTRIQASSMVADRPVPSCQLRLPVRWARNPSLSDCQSRLPTSVAAGNGGGGGPPAQPGSAAAAYLRRLSLGQVPMSSCACAMKVADLGPSALAASERCANGAAYRPATTTGVLGDILRKEGASALWRGTDTAILASIPMVGVYMPLYDHLLARAAPVLGPYAPVVAGSAARTLAVLLVGPLELVRTRQQGSASGARTAWGALRETLRDTAASAGSSGAAAGGGGAGAGAAGAGAGAGAGSAMAVALRTLPRLWTGVAATLARDVPFSAIYWGMVEPIRGGLLARWEAQEGPQRSGGPGSGAGSGGSEGPGPSGRAVLAANLVAGSSAGAAAAVVTTPFDVVKTRLQVGDVRGGAPRQGALDVAQRVLAEQGPAGLFRGWGPRAARTAPACAVVVASYEVLKMVL